MTDQSLSERQVQVLAGIRAKGGDWTPAMVRDYVFAAHGVRIAPERGHQIMKTLAHLGYLEPVRPRAYTYRLKLVPPVVPGWQDEPQEVGTIVVVNLEAGYNHMEVWVRSGANIGNWYYLGNEAGRAYRGEVPVHPTWPDVLKRGEVTVLSPGDPTTYRNGWRNGRYALWREMEGMIDE